jgi:hypothetical protein
LVEYALQPNRPESGYDANAGVEPKVWTQNSLNGEQNLTGSTKQFPARRFAYAPAPIDHPLNVIVTGAVQNPSLIIPVNVIVTIPVVGF